MRVTVDVGGAIDLLLVGSISDDDAQVIGLSRAAFLEKKDPGHVFLPAALWHDAAYVKDSGLMKVMARHQVDAEFLNIMLKLAHGDRELEHEAIQLYECVRKWGAAAWEGDE